MKTILVVDDDPHILEVLSYVLERAGHQVLSAGTGRQALELFSGHKPELIVLDVGLPDIDGLEVLRQLSSSQGLGDTRVLFLSARDEEIDRVLGLEMGADDYVTKPFSPRELVARVKAILRRRDNSEVAASQRLSRGIVKIDQDRAEVSCDGKPVRLTAQELAFLCVMMRRPGHLFDRARLIELAYDGRIFVSDRTVDSHIRNIRSKFAAAGSDDVVQTVPRLGFRIGSCDAALTTQPK